MKKKRILLGIALASASIFALASCGGSSDNTTDDDNQSETGGNGQNASGNEGQGGGQQGGGEGQGGGQQTETKYSITYNVNGVGTAPANKADVTAITDADLAAISAPGYKFDGWFTDAALTTAAVAGNISANTTLYAKWTGASYQTVKAKGNVALDETFDDPFIVNKYTYYNSVLNTEVFFRSVPNKDKPNSPKENYSYTMDNGKFTLVDVEQSDTKGSAKAYVNFGDTTNAKILEGYVDVTIPKKKDSSWTFFQLYGTDTAKTNNEIFGLRTKDGKVLFRLDGGTEKSDGILNQLTLSDNLTFGIHIVIDQVAGTLTLDIVKENGEVLPYVKDLAIPGYVISTHYLFTSVDGGTEVLSFDNVLLRAEGTIDDVDQYKAKVLAYYNPLLAEMDARYVTYKNEFTAAKNALVAAVEAATTKEAIEALLDMSSQQTASPEMAALMQYPDDFYLAQIEVYNTYNYSNYSININQYTNALNNLSDAETIEELNAAKDAFASIVPDADAKVDYITEKVAAFQTDYPASNYTYEDTDYNNKTAYDELVASITGNHKNDIDNAYYSALINISSIPTNAALLDSAKTNYKNSLSSYRTNISGKNPSDDELTEIANYYAGTTFSTKVSNSQAAIEECTSLATIRSAYSSFTALIDADINGIIMSLDDYKTNRKNQIQNVDAPNYKENQDDDIKGLIDTAVTLYCNDIDSATTKDAVKEQYNACIAQFELIYYKRDARAEFRQWITTTYFTADAEKEIKTTKNAVLNEFNTVKENAEQAIFNANSESDVDAAVTNGKAAYEDGYQQLLSYQFDVDFENVDMDTVNVVYGNTLSKPADPTVAADKLFVGWYEDSTFTTAFDFTKLIYEDTTIYAKIVDAVTVTLNYNATINNVTTKSVKIESGTTISSTELNVTQDDAMLFDWYQNADFSGAAFTSDTVVNANTEIYARWLDVYKDVVTTVITDNLTTEGQRPGYVDANTHPNTVVSQEIITYKFNADLSKDVIMSNGTIKGLAFNDASTSDGKRYIEIVLNSKGKIKFAVGNYTDNVGYVSIGTAKATATSNDAGVVTVPKKKDNTGLTEFESAVLEAGTYYINWSRKQLLFNYITVEQYKDVTKVISGITATLTPETDAISISDVKLSISGSSDPISITEGYSVYLDEETTPAVITDGKIAAVAGEHTVTIKYGKYTVYRDSVTVE